MGNQLGKTSCGAAEVAFHVTGRYPKWWTGKRFPGPIRCWVGGNSIEACRDNPQRALLGSNLDEELGTGLIPKDCIGKVSRKQIPDAADRAMIRHVSGQWSSIGFKSYDQGRRKWQGATLHMIWFDEEPPADVYTEGLARLTNTNGVAFLTMTPLEGMTEVVSWFYPEPNTKDRALFTVGIENAGLYSPEQIRKKLDSYPEHERAARAQGIPMLGSGLVFPFPDAAFVTNLFEIPRSWPQIIGMDFGGEHPTAAVRMARDPQTDRLYVMREYKEKGADIVPHVRAIKAMGGDRLPVVWPHDGMTKHPGAKNEQTTSAQYRAEGLRMWPSWSTHPDGGFGKEAVISEMLDRIKTGRFKVMNVCPKWIEECHTYHRKDGDIVRKFDDLMSATQKAVMMKRAMRAEEEPKRAATPEATGTWDVFGGLSGGGNFAGRMPS